MKLTHYGQCTIEQGSKSSKLSNNYRGVIGVNIVIFCPMPPPIGDGVIFVMPLLDLLDL